MRTLTNNMRQAAAAAAAVMALVSLTGCDELMVAGLASGLAGYSGLGGYGGYSSGYNSGYTYYDPTSTIQDAIDYRTEVMDNSMTAWDQYITGDYYGGDNDDPATPTYWASGPEWP